MNYHNITKCDMKNGPGLRVVLWLSGCTHHCKGCHNPITWDPNGGIPFDNDAKIELLEELQKPYCTGITLSGGDPLHPNNRQDVLELLRVIKLRYPTKSVWMYTGYTWEELMNDMQIISPDRNPMEIHSILQHVDVLVDGEFDKSKADQNYHWAGSTNQRKINAAESLMVGGLILYESN